MNLEYRNKKTESEILQNSSCFRLCGGSTTGTNRLIFGENYEVLKRLLFDHNLGGKVDLIYIDPPFATNNVFRISKDRANTISSSHADEMAYADQICGMDFIEFLRERLVILRELMSEKASIYLHIDYKIGHYVKIAMDEIFGISNFRNDITRIKCNPKNFSRKAYGNVKDLILFYTKTNKYTWNDPIVPFSEEDISRLFKKKDAAKGLYTTIPLHAPGETKDGPTGQEWRGMRPPKGRHWRSHPDELEELDKKGLIEWSVNGVPRKKIFAKDASDKGKKMQDVWEFKDSQTPIYPTEKNIDMIKTIINASSNKSDLVMDCFMGSGTTILAAYELERAWIGIDQSKHAIDVTKKRLKEAERDLFLNSGHYDFLKLEAVHNEGVKV